MIYPIRIIKLLSGEVLIAGIAETSKSSSVYTLERPMIVVVIPTVGKNKEPQSTVFINNWIDFSNDEMFIVQKSAVVCAATPDQNILKDYTEAKIKFDLMEAEDELRESQGKFEDEGEEYHDDEEENPHQ